MDLSSFEDKQKLQYVLFPEGVMYNKEANAVRTGGSKCFVRWNTCIDRTFNKKAEW